MTIGLVLVALGIVTAILVWRRDTAADPARILGRMAPLLRSGFRFDDAQRALVIRPVQALATTVWLGDARVVDGAVRGVGAGAVRLGRRLARLHTGLPRSLAAVLAGAVLLALVAVLVGGAR
jgi:NADH-quinone oxidoreductase subunit L